MKKRILSIAVLSLFLTATSYAKDGLDETVPFPVTMTKIADYDMYSPNHNDMFLMNLSAQYKSFATYETYIMKDYTSGEYFSQKALSAYSGQKIAPENPANWKIENDQQVRLSGAYDDLMSMLRQNTGDRFPQLMAEAQAKFDCWVEQASEADNQAHIQECRARFFSAMQQLAESADKTCGGPKTCGKNKSASSVVKNQPVMSTPNVEAWPDTAHLIYMNNVGWKSETPITVYHKIEVQGSGVDSRDIEQMKADIRELKVLYSELRNQINNLPRISNAEQGEVVKVVLQNETQPEFDQEFEILFDFDSDKVKPEYRSVMQTVANLTTQGVEFCVGGYTDTVGKNSYNYNLGQRRAKSVKDYIINSGGNSEYLCTKSYGETNLKVLTSDNVKKQDNRRVWVTEQ